MNKIGIYPTYWEKDWVVDVEKYIRKVAGIGFDVLELNIANFVDTPTKQLHEVRKVSADEGLELTYSFGLGLEHDIANSDDGVRRAGVRFLGQVLDCVHELGGKLIAGITYCAWHATLGEGEVDKRAAWGRSIECVREVAKKAEDLGIVYCVEVVNRFEAYLLNTAEEASRYVREVGSPAVKILLDTFHMNIEEDSFRDPILVAGKDLAHFHVGEANRKAPGQGRIPWDEVMGALREIGYTGRIVMEPFVQAGGSVGKDISVWRDLIDSPTTQRLDRDAAAALRFVRERV
ncbi:MAG TPA: sugar phosphate isomerase/epimerase [Spirochaetia bacterium]|nr:sugar phosphate isomerase/epimerase [Spirochaetia bacterium]